MSSLDILILVILIGFSVCSLFRGFVREAFSLGGVILGVVVANTFYSPFAKILLELTHSDYSDIARALAYFILFIATVMIMIVFGWFFGKSIQKGGLKHIDRILGLMVGFAKGLIVAAILVMVLSMILPEKSIFIKNSQIATYFESVYSLMPEDFAKKLRKKKEDVRNYIRENSSSENRM